MTLFGFVGKLCFEGKHWKRNELIENCSNDNYQLHLLTASLWILTSGMKGRQHGGSHAHCNVQNVCLDAVQYRRELKDTETDLYCWPFQKLENGCLLCVIGSGWWLWCWFGFFFDVVGFKGRFGRFGKVATEMGGSSWWSMSMLQDLTQCRS